MNRKYGEIHWWQFGGNFHQTATTRLQENYINICVTRQACGHVCSWTGRYVCMHLSSRNIHAYMLCSSSVQQCDLQKAYMHTYIHAYIHEHTHNMLVCMHTSRYVHTCCKHMCTYMHFYDRYMCTCT